MDNLDQIIEVPEKGRCINNGRSNTIIRVSTLFRKKIEFINKKRGEYNLNDLSGPKITELMVKHKLWYRMQEDIINFLLEEDMEWKK